MTSGIVKWFSSAKGYGFIMGRDGSEIYFHSTSIRENDGGLSLTNGTAVEFDLIETRLGFEATNIRCAAL